MKELSYRSSGVDLDKAESAKKRISELAKSTFTPDVLTGIGNFGGTFRTPQDDVLVASSDGVGTKLMIAAELGILDTVGIDLVNHCVNDIAVMGALPMFFLDYIGHSDLEPDDIAAVISGFSKACQANGLALIGGETAQMPGIYPPGHFDLVGFIVGKATSEGLLTGERISDGDIIVGFPSTGLHTNGYSLARKVFEDDGFADEYAGKSLGQLLLEPHRSYLTEVKWLMEKTELHGMAHITGGGIAGNLIRVLPIGLDAFVEKATAPKPMIFNLIAERGVAEDEMYRVFNMGFGYLAVVAEKSVESVLDRFDDAFVAGRIEKGDHTVHVV